jgi:hypothetical protein
MRRVSTSRYESVVAQAYHRTLAVMVSVQDVVVVLGWVESETPRLTCSINLVISVRAVPSSIEFYSALDSANQPTYLHIIAPFYL